MALLARYVTAIYDNVLQERNISSSRLHVLVILYADEARDILGE